MFVGTWWSLMPPIVAIALVLLFTYAMELGFTVIKEQKGNM